MVEGEGADSTGGVSPDSGEGFELSGIAREFSCKIFEDKLGRFLKISDPVVISQTFPGLQNLFFRGRSDVGDVWKFCEEFLVAAVCYHRGNGGLLQHDFRNEDGPGVAGLAPWPVLPFLLEPIEES